MPGKTYISEEDISKAAPEIAHLIDLEVRPHMLGRDDVEIGVVAAGHETTRATGSARPFPNLLALAKKGGGQRLSQGGLAHAGGPGEEIGV